VSQATAVDRKRVYSVGVIQAKATRHETSPQKHSSCEAQIAA
jgi:hypothetical protein